MKTEEYIDYIVEELKDYAVPLSYETRVINILEALKSVIELIERDVRECETADDTENYEYDVKSKLVNAIRNSYK